MSRCGAVLTLGLMLGLVLGPGTGCVPEMIPAQSEPEDETAVSAQEPEPSGADTCTLGTWGCECGPRENCDVGLQCSDRICVTDSTSEDQDETSFLASDHMLIEICDIWGQDCPEGEKCVPYAAVNPYYFDAHKCSPVAESPKKFGELCSTPMGEGAGADDCDLGLICAFTGDEQAGVCIELCTGAPENPHCPSPNQECSIDGNGVYTVCHPLCDPLGSECQDFASHSACIPGPGIEGFWCGRNPSGETNPIGAPCMFRGSCVAGSFCAAPEYVPGCENDAGCCSAYCDLRGDGAPCSAGQECVPWFDTAFPDEQHVGACLVSQ